MGPAKTAEPIEMPFGRYELVEVSWFGPRNHVLDGGVNSQGEGAILGGCPTHCTKSIEKHWDPLLLCTE